MKRTDGVPLFAEELTRFILEGEGRSAVRNIPATVHDSLIARLDRLGTAKEIAQVAAVIGREFSYELLQEVSSIREAELQSALNKLLDAELIYARGIAPDALYQFRHAFIQDAAYQALLKSRRRELHGRTGASVESLYAECLDDHLAELVHHYQAAGKPEKTIEYTRRAGERAAAQGAAAEAEGHYRHALKSISELPQTMERDRLELVVQMALADVLWSSKSWSHPDASNAYERVQELAGELGETPKLEEASLGLIVSALGGRQFKKAREIGQRALMRAKNSADRAGLCATHAVLGQALLWSGEYMDAQTHLEWASVHYQEGDRGEWGLDACGLLPLVLLTLGYADRARALMKEAFGSAGRCADPFRAGLVHMWGGLFFELLRDGRLMIEQADALESIASKHLSFSGVSNLLVGKALMIQGNLGEGIRYVRKAIAFNDGIGCLFPQPFEKLYEAESLASEGEVDRALSLTADVIADTEELAHLRSPALLRRAELLAQNRTEASTVEAAYRAAIEPARIQGAKYHELRATISFARWLQSHGRASEALGVLADIYSWFTEGFDIADLKDAKALLEELSGSPR